MARDGEKIREVWEGPGLFLSSLVTLRQLDDALVIFEIDDNILFGSSAESLMALGLDKHTSYGLQLVKMQEGESCFAIGFPYPLAFSRMIKIGIDRRGDYTMGAGLDIHVIYCPLQEESKLGME